MTSLPPEEDQLAQMRDAIARLFQRMREVETRLEALQSTVAAPSAGLPPVPASTGLGEPLTAVLVDRPATAAAPDLQPAPAPPAAARPAPIRPPSFTGSPAAASPFLRAGGQGGWERTVGQGAALESLIGGRWMTWLGALTLIVAMGFFIPWAWQYFQLPAWSRVLAFHLAGVGLLISAWWLDRRGLPIFARGLAGLGLFTLYASAYAAQHLYGLWGSAVTLLECSLITLVAITAAVRADSRAVILLGALGGFLTPIIASTGQGEHVALFTYLACLNVALIASAVLRSWSFVKPLALAATAILFGVWVASPQMDAGRVWSTQWLVVLHSVIFLAGTTVPPVVWQRRSHPLDLLALASGSLWFIGMTWLLFHERSEQQLALVCWGLTVLHAVLFAVTYARVTHADRMPRVHLALAALFFTLAAPLQLEDSLSYLAVTWSVQGLIFTAVGVYFRDRQMCVTALVVFGLALVRLFLFDYTAAPELLGTTGLDRRLLMFLMSAATMIAAGALYWVIGRAVAESEEEEIFWAPAGAGLLALGNVVGMIGLTCQWDGRLVLLLWTLDVAVIWLAGFILENVWLRSYGLVLAVGMVGSRALYHGDDVEGTYRLLANDRFVSLAGVTALYFAAGWLYRRLALAGRPATVASRHVFAREGQVDLVLGVLANVVLVTALSLEIQGWFDAAELSGSAPFPDMRMARMATYSIVWALYAAALVGAGFWLRYRLLRIVGLAAFLPILLKVFLVDLASLELFPRVLALAVLGVALLAVSFLYQRFRSLLEGEPS